MKETILIFDTTLRDGEQSPGASMNFDEKFRIAKILEKLGVDIIEAGYPAASEGDFKSVENIAKNITNSRVCGLSRAIARDIEIAGKALKNAKYSRIHTFIATSPIHMKNKLKMTEDEVVDNAIKAVKLARNFSDDVEFSPEDAARSEFDFLCKIIEKAIDSGARTINIPDTVGYAIPEIFGNLFKRLKENIPNSDKAIFSAHCHNDLGLATANALSAIKNGARQIECTINGLGERAGNTALEEVVMAINTRKDYFGFDTNINTQHILSASQTVSSITGFAVQPNKAIVGLNAFAHEAGIHQDGVLKHRETYEIMKAEDVGWGSNQLVLGKHSGKHALKDRLSSMGIELNEEQLADIFIRFKNLADRKHNIHDQDLQALMSDFNFQEVAQVKLNNLKVKSKANGKAVCKIEIEVDGKIKKAKIDSHNGQVDACFSAIQKILPHSAELELYCVKNITQGIDAQGDVSVRLRLNEKIITGSGRDTDIVVASAKAYLDALSQLLYSSDINKITAQL